MPNYEYRCLHCHRRFLRFISYSDYGKIVVSCPHCGSLEVQRKIGRVRFARSEDSRLDNMTDFNDLEGLDEDPRSLGRMMRKMSGELGEEMGPEFHDVIDRLEAGQSPEEIEQAMPDLGQDGPGGDNLPGGMDDF